MRIGTTIERPKRRRSMLTMRLLLLDTMRSPHQQARPPCAVHELPIQPAFATISTPDAAQRQLCVSYICQQRSYRLRHQTRSNVDLGQLRRDLQHRRTLVAHTVYECSTCGERALGERRCVECGLFMQALGLGGTCQGCDETILLSELLGLE